MAAECYRQPCYPATVPSPKSRLPDIIGDIADASVNVMTFRADQPASYLSQHLIIIGAIPNVASLAWRLAMGDQCHRRTKPVETRRTNGGPSTVNAAAKVLIECLESVKAATALTPGALKLLGHTVEVIHRV